VAARGKILPTPAAIMSVQKGREAVEERSMLEAHRLISEQFRADERNRRRLARETPFGFGRRAEPAFEMATTVLKTR